MSLLKLNEISFQNHIPINIVIVIDCNYIFVCARFSFLHSADMCHMHVRTMYVVSLCVHFFLFCNRNSIGGRVKEYE